MEPEALTFAAQYLGLNPQEGFCAGMLRGGMMTSAKLFVSQIQDWLDKGVSDFAQMSNLPQALREELSQTFTIPCVKIEKKLVSSLDNTVKYLYGLPDGETVESVLMEYKHGWSQCLSTQVGCRMGCSFCATGMGGFVRNLLPSEMLAQIEQAQTDNGIRVSSVVLMGMGEPLDNYDNVLRFLRL